MAAEALPYVPASINPEHIQDEDGAPTAHSFTQLLTFSLEHVENLYTVNPSTHEFQFHYSEGEFMTRLRTITNPASAHFSTRFETATSDINGINYLGCIHITFDDLFTAQIRVPGERTYDPAGKTDSEENEVVDARSFHLLVSMTVAQVMAARCGAEVGFVRDISRVTKPVMDKYCKRLWMHEWMTFQVEKACYEKAQPLDYPGYLNLKILSKAMILHQDQHQHTRQFLDSSKPPRSYYTVLII